MRRFKRILSLVLAVALCVGSLAASAAAKGSDSAFGGSTAPVVLIHGNTQSDVYLYQADNVTRVLDADGNPVKNWMPKVDVPAMLLQLIGPLLLSVVFQCDFGLTGAVRNVVSGAMPLLKMDANGMPANNMRVQSYADAKGNPLSLAECSKEMRDIANERLHMDERDQRLGDDRVYFFAYDSFGNNAVNTKALAEYIKSVSKKHGGSKVSVVPISLGGTLMNSLMEDYYDEVVPLLQNVVFVVPAADGTNLVGDVYMRKLSVDNKNLYHDMFPALLGAFPGALPGWMQYLINAVIRVLPKRVLHGMLDAVVDGLVGEYLSRNTTLWSLVPSGSYETAREIWLKGDSYAAIRAQTDHYYQAQKNSRANILRMRADGVRVYDICEYDTPLIAIASSYTKVNSDSVIHLDSASLGATAGYVNTPLPKGYRPVNPRCTDPAHNHRSPNGVVDASTGTLPEQTWYFKGGLHNLTSDNDLAMRLIIRLVTSGEYETVYSMDAWPQFNNARESRAFRVEILPQAEAVDPATLAAADAKELAAAIAEARAVLAKTVDVPGEYSHAYDRVVAILVKLGLREAEKPDYAAMVLDPLFALLSDLLYCTVGPRGFFDPFWAKWQ